MRSLRDHLVAANSRAEKGCSSCPLPTPSFARPTMDSIQPSKLVTTLLKKANHHYFHSVVALKISFEGLQLVKTYYFF